MWRSIGARYPLTRNLGRKLVSRQNPSSCSSQSHQVFQHQSSNFSSCCTSYLFNRQNTSKFAHQSLRFLSHSSSSITEFESENHDPTSSSSEGEVENDTHDVSSSQGVNFTQDFDRNDENNGAQISGLSSVDELAADFDGNVEKNGDQMSGFGSIDGLGAGLGGNVENSGAEMSDFRLSQKLGVAVPSKTVDVEKYENVLSLLQGSVDESLESSLDGLEMEFSLNEELVERVIKAPLVPRVHLIRFIKWAKVEFIITSKVLGSLTRVVCDSPKRMDVYALWDLVKEVGTGQSDVVNVEILNELISAFSELGKGKAAYEVFGMFEKFGCEPNADTYYLTTVALCKRSFYDWAVGVSQKMLDAGILPASEELCDIISLYCKGYRTREAHIIYLAAKKNNKYPPQRAVNFLISCLSKADDTVPLAKEMLADFSVEARKHAINPFSWVVRGLCRKNDIEGGKKLLLEMIEKGPPPGNAVFNTVISALSKAGDLGDAKEILKLMESRGLKPDVYSYTVIISGYAKGGMMEEACKVLSEARRTHPKLCPATFHTLIRGYCKLEQFDKAVKLLSDMKKFGVEPNGDEFNKLIQSLCLKALDWETAEKLLEEMKTKGLHLPGITRGLINAVKELQQEAVVSEEAVAES